MTADLTPAPHPAFSPSNPFRQIAWDATSLELFLRDPWTYFCTIIEGWRMPLPSAALLFGSLYHESCGHYCLARLEGASHDAALDAALAYAIRAAAEGAPVVGEADAPCTNCDGMGTLIDPDQAENYEAAPCVFCGGTGRIKPNWSLDEIAANSARRADRNQRDTYRLLRAVVWWCDLYGDDPLYTTIRLPSGRPAIEVHFDLPLGFRIGPDDARLCGHIDGIVQAATGELIVREWKHTTSTIGGDRKSAAYYFLRYKPNVQINTYALAGKLLLPSQPVRGVLVEACQTSVTFAHFEREWIDRPEPILSEWIDCIEHHTRRASALADQAADLAASGRDPATIYARAMNPATMRQYGSNTFADAAFRLPRLRRAFLASRMVRGPRWNPTEARDAGLPYD